MKNKLILITGGARSGKSSFAQKLADAIEGRKVFLATAEALDEEMKSRIEIHKKERPSGWVTIEETKHLSKALITCNGKFEVILIDCLTMWISNLLANITFDESQILKEVKRFISSCREIKGTVILVANEVGLGIVPANRLARIFRDIAGKANQEIAAVADDVYLVVAGISLKLKGVD
jgi:adenosylcobinamide kinase / adenosylcobinamide-phosphate guanylyltransferase